MAPYPTTGSAFAAQWAPYSGTLTHTCKPRRQHLPHPRHAKCEHEVCLARLRLRSSYGFDEATFSVLCRRPVLPAPPDPPTIASQMGSDVRRPQKPPAGSAPPCHAAQAAQPFALVVASHNHGVVADGFQVGFTRRLPVATSSTKPPSASTAGVGSWRSRQLHHDSVPNGMPASSAIARRLSPSASRRASSAAICSRRCIPQRWRRRRRLPGGLHATVTTRTRCPPQDPCVDARGWVDC